MSDNNWVLVIVDKYTSEHVEMSCKEACQKAIINIYTSFNFRKAYAINTFTGEILTY